MKRKNVTLVLVFTILIGLVGCAMETETVSQELSQPEVVEETVEAIACVGAEMEIVPRCIPGYTKGYLTHPEYNEYELSEESMAYLDQIIERLESEQYQEAIDMLDADEINRVLDDCVVAISRELGGYNFQNLIYKDKKIAIDSWNVKEGGCSVEIVILPMEEGRGYYLKLDDNPHFDSYYYSYLYGECIEGQFNGVLKIYDWMLSRDNDHYEYIYGTGTAQDGVLHGELLNSVESTWGNWEDDSVLKYTDITVYEEGHLMISDIMIDESDENTPLYAIYGTRVYEDGRECELAIYAAYGADHYIEDKGNELYSVKQAADGGNGGYFKWHADTMDPMWDLSY